MNNQIVETGSALIEIFTISRSGFDEHKTYTYGYAGMATVMKKIYNVKHGVDTLETYLDEFVDAFVQVDTGVYVKFTGFLEITLLKLN